MKNYKELSRKEKAEYIAILILYPFLLLFGWMGKTIKMFGTRRRQIVASVLSFALILTMLPIGVLNALAADTNLIVNPGGEIANAGYGELSSNGWNEDTSPVRGYPYNAFVNNNGITLAPKSGSFFMGFYATGTTYPDGVSCYQDITVSGQPSFAFTGYASLKKDTTGSAIIQIDALNGSGGVINTWANTVISTDGDWKQVTLSDAIPAGTNKLRVTIKGILNGVGLAAFDDLSLTLGSTAPPSYVVENITTGTKYETLQAAINAVSNNDTIRLLDTITITDKSSITVGGANSFTLNLNGKTLDGGSGYYDLLRHTGSGTLTINDSGTGGKITSSRSNSASSGTIGLYTGNGSLIINSGMVENTASSDGVAINNEGTGTTSIKGGTVRSASYCCVRNYSTGSVIISGGVIECFNGSGIMNRSNGNVTVSGGMISGSIYGILQYPTGMTMIIGGSPVIKGGTCAITKAPDLSGYANVQVTASTNINGANPTPYDETKIGTYKYLAFAPGGAVSLTENFDDITTLATSGWTMKNNSASIGTTSWFQGSPPSAGGPFISYNGSPNSYIAANYNNTGIANSTISNWLVTPKLLLTNGSTLTFYTKKPSPDNYPDRLEVRMSTSGSNPGTGPADVGDFTTLLLSINPTQVTGVYPTEWKQYTVTLSGLSESASGYLAFRYFVTNAGNNAPNSDYIGIDAVTYTAGIDFTASGYSAAYDGQSHGINLNVKTPGATVKYRTTAEGAYDLTVAPSFSDVGTHTVWYQISKEGHSSVEGSQTVNITSKALTVNLAVSNKNYDGLNTATYSAAPALVGVLSGDKVSLVDGTPTFSSVGVGDNIPISLTAFSITGEDADNYSLTQPSGITANILEGFTPVKETHYTATSLNDGWTNTNFVIAAKNGYLVSLTNTAAGTWFSSLNYNSETNSGSVTFYVKNTATKEISAQKSENFSIDKTAPTGDIKMGTNSIKKVLNTITFGFFFKQSKSITITSADTGSGVKSVVYKLSSIVLDEDEVPQISDWTAYTSAFTVEPNSKTVVYAKITDKAGNLIYLGSDGVVLFTDSTAGTTSINFIKTSTTDVTVTVSLNGNTVKAITVGETELVKDKDYTVSGDTISLKAAYLDTLAAGDYTAVVSYYPLGETVTPKEGSDTPATTSFALTVSKAVPSVSVVASPAGTQTRPGSVTLSANLPADATGTLQFKANGNNIGAPVAVGQTVSFAASGSENSYAFMVYYSGDDTYESANASVPPYLFVKGEQDALNFAVGTPTAKTYGDASFSVTATGGNGTGTVTYSVVSGPATISGNTVTLIGAGTVKIKATKEADNDYNVKSVEHEISVSHKPVTITGVTAQSKIYDSNKTATVSGTATISGKLSGDNVSVVQGTASFVDKIVGNDKTVTFTGFALSGADAGKYTLTAQPASVTANITAKPITMDVSIQPKAYDGLNTATIASATLNDVVLGDVVALNSPYPTATFTSVSVANNIAVSFGNNFTLTGADAGNYTLMQPSAAGNITNTYHAVKGTDYTVNNTGWSNTDFVITAKAGFELSYTNTADGAWSSTLTKSDETSSGSTNFYVRNKATGAISLEATESYKIDKTLPTGDIKIDESSIKKALNTITFGLFFKETLSIEVTANDTGSGVASVVYKLSFTILSENEVLQISDWTEYTDMLSLEPEQQTVVYAKVTDTAGNVTYLGSDGLVIENTAPVISGIENEKVYCAEVTVTITDENLDTITVNGTAVTLTDGQLTLAPIGAEQTIVATDKAGNSTTVTVTVYDGHDWDEGIITTAPTVEAEGVKTHNCTHCGDVKTEAVAKLPPTITEGARSSWQPDSPSADAGLTFRSEASFDDFICVLVNGKVLDSKYYDLKEGSIIVTLKADYLATLPAGTYTIGIQSTSGTASTEFTIATKADDKSPQTGDFSNAPLWIVLLFVSSSALSVLGIKRRKRKAVK